MKTSVEGQAKKTAESLVKTPVEVQVKKALERVI
jgi:hypothetical protein